MHHLLNLTHRLCQRTPLIVQALRRRSVAWLQLMTCCVAAFGQPPEDQSEQLTDGPRTFAEAKALGRERSAILGRQASGATESPTSKLDDFDKVIKPILKSACVDCHGDAMQEGNLRIDTLDPDLAHGDHIDWWLEVQAVLSNGEMPPPGEGDLADADRARIVEWLSNEIQFASLVRRASGGHSSFRRMTRYEFNCALQDLLGLPYDFAKDLTPDPRSEDGFQNSSEVLQMSVSQLETYRRSAHKALMRATVRGDRPPVLHWGVTMQDAGRIDWARQENEIKKAEAESIGDPPTQASKRSEVEKRLRQPHPVPYYKNLETGRTVRATWNYTGARYANKPTDERTPVPTSPSHVAILPREDRGRLTIELGNRVPDEGIMRVRVHASRTEAESAGAPSLQLLFGWRATNEGRAVLPVPGGQREITAAPGGAEVYQWDVPLGEIYPRNSFRKTSRMGALPNPSEYLRLVNRSVSQGSIQINYVEVAAPVYDEWPPASHRRVFPDSDQQGDEQAYAREVIASFMQRAWRRPIRDDELDQKMRLFAAMRPACGCFEEAVVEVLSTVLASPQFLYISRGEGEQGQLAAHELATRLSVFLWCSLPDEQLRQLADTGALLENEVLHEQVTRMLADDRSKRLSEHFVRQWLDMQLLEFRTVPRKLTRLKEAMKQEPIAVFDAMLRDDASVLDFLHADYTIANERLALHYGLPGVEGNRFRRVELPPDSHRGGLLTQAGLLTMNSAGDESHPLKRGVWLLESLLNDPPPPPPPAVPEIDLTDPEIAKMTLKERIEDHRNHPACLSCHAKIDPWGIAFENYDALGRWRTEIDGKPVDATSMLVNQQRLDGMEGLKRRLLEDRQDQFVRAVVHKLTTYALGRPLTFSDRAAVDEITTEVRQRGDGLATTIESIATSDLFRSR